MYILCMAKSHLAFVGVRLNFAFLNDKISEYSDFRFYTGNGFLLF